MTQKNGTFTGQRGLKIYWQAWLPEGKPKATVQLSHGIAEHAGRYLNLVNELVPRGIAVYANDHRGHGKSEGQRCYVDSFEDFVEDARTFREIIRKEQPSGKLFLVGHSMGALIAGRLARKYPDLHDAIVLSGSGNGIGGDVSPVLLFASKILSVIAPKLTLQPTDMSAYISHDPVVVEAYRTDPLDFLKGVSARLGAELMRVAKENPSVIAEIKKPFMFVAGSGDRLVLGAREASESITAADKTIIIYEGLWHEVFNETEAERKKVLKDVGDWIQARI